MPEYRATKGIYKFAAISLNIEFDPLLCDTEGDPPYKELTKQCVFWHDARKLLRPYSWHMIIFAIVDS